MTMAGSGSPARRKSEFPLWGVIALPACALWGTLLGALTGMYFGNLAIGAAIGAGLGISLGLSLFAAAIVVASSKL